MFVVAAAAVVVVFGATNHPSLSSHCCFDFQHTGVRVEGHIHLIDFVCLHHQFLVFDSFNTMDSQQGHDQSSPRSNATMQQCNDATMQSILTPNHSKLKPQYIHHRMTAQSK